jgi:hypothetical protein
VLFRSTIIEQTAAPLATAVDLTHCQRNATSRSTDDCGVENHIAFALALCTVRSENESNTDSLSQENPQLESPPPPARPHTVLL